MLRPALKAAMSVAAALVVLAIAATFVVLASSPFPSRGPWTSASRIDGFAGDPPYGYEPGSVGQANRAWPHGTPAPSPDPTVALGPDPTTEQTPDPTADLPAAPTSDPTAAPTQDPTAAPTTEATPTATPDPTPDPTPVPTPDPSIVPPSGTYTFDEEFNGSLLDPTWLRHFHCCGELAGYDPTLSTVANGALSMRVDHRSTGWYGDLIDTKTTFTQRYGYFEARIKVPKGAGLWPAFWSYYSGDGTEGEIDGMEICANEIGDHGGNDASLLHTTIHWSGGASGSAYRSVDLSQGYHVYAFDWRSTSIKFYLDGQLVWTFTDTAHIPTMELPVILNLGIGGTWCGSPDVATGDGAEMLVDWVRVRA